MQKEPNENSIKKFLNSRSKALDEDFDPAFLAEVTEETDPLFKQYFLNRLSLEGENINYEISMIIDKCESPIEKLLVAAVINLAYEFGHEAIDFHAKSRTIVTANVCQELLIEPQFKIDKHRVDFAFTQKEHYPPEMTVAPKTILVECDGHDFHERNKDQAKKDRSRDRRLQQLGYKILRYTGSEIYQDPFKCAKEILQTLNKECRA